MKYFYTLKDVIFFLENSNLSVADYRKKSVEARITAVVEQDRHDLLSYLTGSIDTCPQLESTDKDNEKGSSKRTSGHEPQTNSARYH